MKLYELISQMGKRAFVASREKNKQLVIQSNEFINASYKSTSEEKRIMLLMITKISPHDKEFKSYRIDIKELSALLDTKSHNLYERVKQRTKQLMSRVFSITKENGLLQVSPISSAEYKHGKGYVELCFDPKLKPYLLQLKECFTVYELKNTFNLGNFSMRIYELLKQYESIGSRTFSLQELKYILGLSDSYKQYNDFKKRIIIPAQSQLKEHSDIYFNFEEIKEGRKITKIKFFIKRKIKQPKLPKPLPDTSKLNQDLIAKLVDLGIAERDAIKYVKTKDNEFLFDCIDKAEEYCKTGKITSSKTGFLISLIKSDKPVRSPEEKRRKKEKEEKLLKAKEQEKIHKEICEFYDEFRSQQYKLLNKFIEKTTEADKQAFFDSLGPNKKICLKTKIFDACFKNYIAKQNCIDTSEEAFIKHMFEKEGLEVRKVFILGKELWAL